MIHFIMVSFALFTAPISLTCPLKIDQRKIHSLSTSKHFSHLNFLYFDNSVWNIFSFQKLFINPLGFYSLTSAPDSTAIYYLDTSNTQPTLTKNEFNKSCTTNNYLSFYEPNLNQHGIAVFCNKNFSAPKNLITSANNIIHTSKYKFTPKTSNQMLFESVTWSNNHKIIAKNSNLNLRADLKNFFTLNFTEDSISTKIEGGFQHSMGYVNFLSFFLKILFLKIDLKLQSNIHFFNQSIHMPVLFNMPADGPKYLNKNSGAMLSFDLPSTSKISPLNMPQRNNANPDEILKECKSSNCQFQSLIKYDEELSLRIFLNVARKNINAGFYPQISRLSKENNFEKWGVFFEASKLSKGLYHADLWLSIGEASSIANLSQCPREAQVTYNQKYLQKYLQKTPKSLAH